MQRELLPCPFCGKTNVTTFGPYGWARQWGISHSCEAFYSGTSGMMQGFPSEAHAMAAWNTRDAAQAIEARSVETAKTGSIEDESASRQGAPKGGHDEKDIRNVA